jgi:MoxR-like ATPase
MQDKFLAVESEMGEVLLERDAEIHSAILALLSRRHLFMFGSPGVAKSLLVDRLCAHITNAVQFKWLLTKHSVPEEIYGGPDLLTLKDKGIYRRITDGKLPQAHFAFLDETFKANSAILNSLLKILNENEFDNPGDDPHVPLISLFAASNELPTNSELNALADRLHLWHNVQPIADTSNFVKMLVSEETEPTAFISLEDIYEAQKQVAQVTIGDDVLTALVELSDRLKEEEIYVTDRKFKQSLSVIKAEAWLSGSDVAEVIHTKPLQHMMWRDPSQIITVRTAVYDLADPIERDVLNLRDEWMQAYNSYRDTMADTTMTGRKADHTLEIFKKFKACKKDLLSIDKRCREMKRECKALDDFTSYMKQIGPDLLSEGFEVDRQDAMELNSMLDKRDDV